MPLPNFFIIGAPKSGSTALYDTIIQHPQIYMSPVKEPLFFACDGEPEVSPGPGGSFMKRNAIWQPHEYMALFADVAGEPAIGDASVVYLRSPIAAERIHHNLPQSKIIAILRHPVERAHSHYWFSVQNGIEPAQTFEEALNHEENGLRKDWFSELHHKSNGFYSRQLARYYALFPREQIKIYLYEDWKENSHGLLRDLFQFLDVEGGYVPVIRRSNITSVPKSRRLHRWAQNPRQLELKLRRTVPRPLHAPLIAAVKAANDKVNQSHSPLIDPQVYNALLGEYRSDILELQGLIGRDISHWLNPL